MKNIILFSCLSLIPFTSMCFAMEEKPSESSAGHIGKQNSFTSSETSEGFYDWNRHLVNETNKTDKTKYIDLKGLKELLNNTEKCLNSNVLKENILPENIDAPNTNTPLTIPEGRPVGSILDPYVVNSRIQTPNISATPEEGVTEKNPMSTIVKTKESFLNDNKKTKKITKKHSLNTEETKPRTRSLSLSLDSKKKSTF